MIWPWITSPLPKELCVHPTLGSILQVSQEIFQSSPVSPVPSPLIPILGNPEFIPGLHMGNFIALSTQGYNHLSDFLTSEGTLMSSDLAHLADPSLDFWGELQLCFFLWRRSRNPGIARLLTGFESLCHRGEPERHFLSPALCFLDPPRGGIYALVSHKIGIRSRPESYSYS